MKSFECWAAEQIEKTRRQGKNPCKVDETINCLPLLNDPVCQACYEAYKEAERRETNAEQKD